MSLHYYRKELVSNAFLVAGKPVAFEVLDGNRGCIAVDDATDPATVIALDAAANKRRGGVSRITEGEYRQIKAFHPFNPSAPKLQKDVLRAAPPSINPLARPSKRSQDRSGAFSPVAAVAAAPAPAASPVPAAPKPTAEAQVAMKPAERFRPATRRISRQEALGEGT